MRLRDNRERRGKTLMEVAEELAAILGRPIGMRTYHRWETGESPAPTDVVEAIRELTGGQVSPVDLHEQRMDYLRSSGRLGSALKIVNLTAA